MHLEGCGIWYSNGQIRENGQGLVCCNTTKCQIVGNLMDSQKQIVIRCSSDDIGTEYEERGCGFGVSKINSGQDLQADDERDNKFS